MLGNLDNEVIFKKAFTDKVVFKAFARDILGIDFDPGKIETEKKFKPKIGYVDFELDIFAESADKRVCIEIQRVEYDAHFDRFLNYFLMLIAEQQRSSKAYNIDQTVYMIVVLTAPYTIVEKTGKPVLDELLLTELNPKNLKGVARDIFGHRFVCLNPNHRKADTPKPIMDWLDLIYKSIHEPLTTDLNTANDGIKKAAELIDFDNLTPTERANAKNKEAGKIVLSMERTAGKQEKAIENAKNGISKGYNNQIIADITGLTTEQIEELRTETE